MMCLGSYWAWVVTHHLQNSAPERAEGPDQQPPGSYAQQYHHTCSPGTHWDAVPKQCRAGWWAAWGGGGATRWFFHQLPLRIYYLTVRLNANANTPRCLAAGSTAASPEGNRFVQQLDASKQGTGEINRFPSDPRPNKKFHTVLCGTPPPTLPPPPPRKN